MIRLRCHVRVQNSASRVTSVRNRIESASIDLLSNGYHYHQCSFYKECNRYCNYILIYILTYYSIILHIHLLCYISLICKRCYFEICKNIWFLKQLRVADPVGNYMFQVNNKRNRTRCEICSKLTIQTPERRQWRRSGVFIVNFEQVDSVWGLCISYRTVRSATWPIFSEFLILPIYFMSL